ncbi:hypothetical protein AAW51_3504 [Caldimonas brevitalea]|uniref:Uncharacterized protein n=1 Tax=Caldimonas brevitalea TaxID=413882 RepID=A0A0G3BUI4_9BURK|nr:hypothetical protein AAW51_3504 [Caldimonas brevitalea]
MAARPSRQPAGGNKKQVPPDTRNEFSREVPSAASVDVAGLAAWARCIRCVASARFCFYFRLNCAAAGGQIGPNSSVSFKMEAAVPADLPGEHVKLSWVLQDGPSAGTIARLR